MSEFTFTSFDSPLQRQWKRDRALRQRIPLDDATRNCLGLAAIFHDVDENECHGERIFYPNENIDWLALRDVPLGHFPGGPRMNAREVSWASLAQADLHHGMPRLDFAHTRNSWDFRRLPYDRIRKIKGEGFREHWAHGDVLNSQEYHREFAVLNVVSRQMTRLAYFGSDRHGQWLRPGWARHRPADGKKFRPILPQRWMPRAYLGFPVEQAEKLFWASTLDDAGAMTFDCAGCGRRIAAADIGDKVFFEDGNFVGDCPRCNARRKWYLSDAIASQQMRRFTSAFRHGFVKSVNDGLPLFATAKALYLGIDWEQSISLRNRSEGPTLWAHQLMCSDGSTQTFHLPPLARLYCKTTATLQAGERWCDLLPSVSPSWKQRSRRERWNTLELVCGGGWLLGHLQSLWFNEQGVYLNMYPKRVFYPADLIATAVREVAPVELVWEFAKAGRFVDSDLAAAIFPAVPVRDWNQFRLALPGDVDVDVSIGDPRFRALGNPARTSSRGRSRRRNITLSSAEPKPVPIS